MQAQPTESQLESADNIKTRVPEAHRMEDNRQVLWSVTTYDTWLSHCPAVPCRWKM